MKPRNNEACTECEPTYPAPTSDGRTARIAQYALPLDAIAAAGEPGRQYVAHVRETSRPS